MSTPSQLSATLDGLAAAWKSNDPAAVAAFFTGDGSLVNPFGERADGRPAVQTMYESYFAGMLGGTTTALRLLAVRELGPGLAFADVEQEVHAANGELLLPLRCAVVFREEGGSWRMADSRPYVLAARPE